jgi:hypothetical protein
MHPFHSVLDLLVLLFLRYCASIMNKKCRVTLKNIPVNIVGNGITSDESQI